MDLWNEILRLALARAPTTPLGWVISIMPIFMSCVTVWMTWLTGHKHPLTWKVGLFGQVLWTIWIIISGTWDLIPVNLTLWVLYYRNHRLWKRDQVASRDILLFVDMRPPAVGFIYR